MTKWKDQVYQSRLLPLVIIALILSLGYIIGLIIDWPSWIRGSNWVWARHQPAANLWRNLLLVIVITAGYVLFQIAKGNSFKKRWQTALFLTALILFSIGVQLVIAAQHRSQPLSVPFRSSSGFFLEGVQLTNPADFLQNHVKAMPYYRDVHLRTQPPGWMLTYWAISKLMDQFPGWAEPLGHWFRRYDCLAFDLQGLTLTQIAATILPISTVFISGLGILPLYWLGKRLFSMKVARIAATFYPFLPAYLVFQGRFDTLYAVLSLLCLWLIVEIVLFDRRWLIILLGLLLGGITFWGYGPIAIVLLVNLFMLSYFVLMMLSRRRTFQPISFILHPFLTVNLSIAFVILILWGGLWLLWDVDGISMFQKSQKLHQILRINYPIWRLFNLYDMAVFMGIPLAVGCMISFLNSLFQLNKLPHNRKHPPIHQLAFVLAWGLAVLVLNLSGQIRAETGRLWLLLFTPGLLVGVVGWTSFLNETQKDTHHSRRPKRGNWIFVAFVVQALATGYFLSGRIPPATVPEPMWFMPKTAVPHNTQLGNSINLNGYEIQTLDKELHVTLYWQVLQRPPEDYSAFVHLLDQNGNVLVQTDGVPLQGELPTWCWVPGEIVADKRVLPLENGHLSIPTNGVIATGLYDWRTGVRLPITPSSPDNMIRLQISHP